MFFWNLKKTKNTYSRTLASTCDLLTHDFVFFRHYRDLRTARAVSWLVQRHVSTWWSLGSWRLRLWWARADLRSNVPTWLCHASAPPACSRCTHRLLCTIYCESGTLAKAALLGIGLDEVNAKNQINMKFIGGKVHFIQQCITYEHTGTYTADTHNAYQLPQK